MTIRFFDAIKCSWLKLSLALTWRQQLFVKPAMLAPLR